MYYAVIMAGGSGTRLWPLSRRSRPKQALDLIGDRTMFQHAIERLAPLFPPERIFVVTGPKMASLLRPQAPLMPPENFIIEPAGRDSGPAAGLAAAHLLHRDPEAIMAMLTADHYIVDTDQFRAALAASEELAAGGAIVTLGMRPTEPATRFGYIQLGPADQIVNGFRVYYSAGFKEKPDLQKALEFLEDGRYVWNGGMFVWRGDRLMAELASQLPELHAALQAIRQALGTPRAAKVLAEQWANIERISIDFGIMEHASDVVVIPVEIGWSDIGSWGSLLDVLPADEDGNVVEGRLVALDTEGCYVRSRDRLVAAIGLRNMVVIDTADAILVCPRERAEEVRKLVDRLAAEGANEYL